MRRIAFINEKGGTCKTTLCVNLGAWLARERKKRVLIVDLDTQGHAGKSLGIDVRGMRPTVLDLLVDPAVELRQVVKRTAIPGLEVVPSNKALAELPLLVASHPDRADKLATKLAGAAGWDYVLFDSPPSLSLVTDNIMRAARELVVPVALTYLALDGCAEIARSVEEVRALRRDGGPEITLVVPALYRKTQLADEILGKLRQHFGDRVAKTMFGYSVKIDEAQSHGQTIWEYASWCPGARALEAIGEELLRRAPPVAAPGVGGAEALVAAPIR